VAWRGSPADSNAIDLHYLAPLLIIVTDYYCGGMQLPSCWIPPGLDRTGIMALRRYSTWHDRKLMKSSFMTPIALKTQFALARLVAQCD
jgi:hypothetical protein